MNVRMRTLSAGPAGTLEIGKVYDLPEKEARALIDGRYAVLEEPPVKAADTGKGKDKGEDKSKGADKDKAADTGKGKA